ncbi:MAG: Nif3-like dinuclear metal center hexameric protein [Ignavibacteria bacterium]|jgi:dinuclear metal center YbgI/SA1388 family protein|nr:Nif3-like dinuclear metal center hexameric protein [Ignavibacteria bacterium]MCU7503511.1 Nif3-like dinuclear metal center hexameric protein [Ignavibacteria bacterium]MCU7517257.1 Nif3-like dinuclear metal center hexameric protein [Ignavibacteria bacterium]
MTAKELTKHIENWAPKEAAWQKDNPGLQAGSLGSEVVNIFLCLELSEKALEEAVKKKCNFIFTHHPLIFQPLKKIDTQNDKTSRLLEKLLTHKITLYSAHTNLDFTKNGVSFHLAKTLGLKNIRFLENAESNQFKLVVFVPETSLRDVSDAIFASGGGVIGEYNSCSYRLKGEGTFQGSRETHPSLGSAGQFEQVSEVRLEVIVDKWNLKSAISAMLKVHPYEEPAFDVYPLNNKNVNYGFGAIGELEESMGEEEFLGHVLKCLKTKNLRYTTGSGAKVKKVALCGGSGSDLIPAAISSGAEAFVTADIKYHTFQDAEGKILLVDAGHYETEFPVLEEVKRRFESLIEEKGAGIKVYIYSGTTNPVNFFQNKGDK